jgi:hypothetical protein
MLRTADDVLEALRARKVALQLSNSMIDEIAGLTDGHFDKAAGPSRVKPPNLYTLMSIIGALGLAVQLVEDPERVRAVRNRWRRRVEHYVCPPQLTLGQARPIVLARAARKAAKARWAGTSVEERRAVAAALVEARLAKRAGTSEAAPHRQNEGAARARAMAAFEAWCALRSSAPCPAEKKALVEQIILA